VGGQTKCQEGHRADLGTSRLQETGCWKRGDEDGGGWRRGAGSAHTSGLLSPAAVTLW
jgi:hypothetical protein